MSRGSKFSGPIEDIVGRTCPGASYCGVDQCFRNGGTCGNSGTCCLTGSQASDLVTSLGCGSGNFTLIETPKKFSTLSEDPSALNKCKTQLSLEQSDIDYMCKTLSPDDCFSRLCNLGCTNPACEKKQVSSSINLQNAVCQTIQQYCDVLDPSLLTDPNYNKLCCNVDPIAGVPDRTACGCPGNPCVSNPVTLKNVQILKASAAKYWKENPPVSSEVTPAVVPNVSPEVETIVIPAVAQEAHTESKESRGGVSHNKSKTTSNSVLSILSKYLVFIIAILVVLVIAGIYYWYKTSSSSSSSSSPSSYTSPSYTSSSSSSYNSPSSYNSLY